MAKITYVEFNSRATSLDLPDGWSRIQAAAIPIQALPAIDGPVPPLQTQG